MSDSPAYVPPFPRVTGDRVSSFGAASQGGDEGDADLDDDSDDITGARAGEGAPDGAVEVHTLPVTRLREGLPPSYRMRAEPHYVEALVDRVLAADSAGPTAPGATMSAPAGPAEPDTAPAAFTLAATVLADAFDAIQAALRDVPLRGRPLRDRVAIELARAEATRGRWLAEAAAVLQIEPLPALDEVDLLQLLAQVLDALAPENRLSGGAAALPVPGGRCPVFGDARLLTTALGATLAAVRALIEDRGDARKVTVTLGPRREAATRTIEVSQAAVRLPASAYPRFFDAGWADHPAGASGAMLLAAARKIARAHGGGLDVFPLAGGGCRLVLGLPAAD